MGPSYVQSLTIHDLDKGEQFINTWLIQKVADRPFPDDFARIDTYLDVLSDLDVYAGRYKEILQHFYIGVLRRQYAEWAPTHQLRIAQITASINSFRQALNTGGLPANPSYFAQWQIGLLLEKLESPWGDVQEALMEAQVLYNRRAEAVTHIIKHYRSSGEVGMAFIFSQVAKDNFPGKIPVERTWGVDPSLYEWKLMNYHMSVCNRLGMVDEAAKAYRGLWALHEAHPGYFSPEQVEQLFKNQQLFAHE